MELGEQELLDQLLALRREMWEINPEEIDGFFPRDVNFDFSDIDSNLILPNSSFEEIPISLEPTFDYPLNAIFTVPDISSSNPNFPPLSSLQDHPSIVGNEEPTLVPLCNLEQKQSIGKMESTEESQIPVFEMGSSKNPCSRRGNHVKRVEGQPSKNLMAERRRRKRLNERLSMLRSVVPKISKMDRTAILGDTIDYMRELLGRIKNLQEEMEMEMGSNQTSFLSIFKEWKQDEIVVRNIPKFDVERNVMDTRIEICCSLKPGLLLSTVSTLEALGLEIQQCVISSFNDFGMQASCSEELEMRARVSLDEIKQALLRNAGYGGRCI